MKINFIHSILCTLILLVGTCTLGFAQIQKLSNPAYANSFTPKLHLSPKGNIYMSWQTKNIDKKHSLWMSKLKGKQWSTPIKVATETKKWFVNWADFPAITTFGKRGIALNYLQKSASSTYAYDVMLCVSGNGGKTWQTPFVAHTDGTPTEHGFVSLAPAARKRFLAVWLDGRETAQSKEKAHDHHGHGAGKKAMTLRAAFFNARGKSFAPVLLDERVCDCCQTSVAQTQQGYVVAYRNRSAKEVRDIGYVTYKNGKWSKPQVLHDDGWKINGCPVNGPSISANGNQVAVAWYTMANNRAKVKVAFSEDGGESFGLPTQVNEGNTLGRVACAVLPQGGALILWLETVDNQTFIRMRKISPQGKLGKVHTISQTSSSRASGFPQIIVQGKRAVLTWTQVEGKQKTLKTAIYTFQ